MIKNLNWQARLQPIPLLFIRVTIIAMKDAAIVKFVEVEISLRRVIVIAGNVDF